MKKKQAIIVTLILIGLIILRGYFLFGKQDFATDVKSIHTLTTNLIGGTGSLTASTVGIPQKPSSDHALDESELKKIQVLQEIFQSKNDNDPRLDTELKNLSVPLKAALKQQYENLKRELLNERGTIVFLLGRELSEGRGTVSDVEFFKNVLLEKPCLSLGDCSKVASGQSADEGHLDGLNETTAQYPQLTGLQALKKSLENPNLSSEIRNAIISSLESARNSPNVRVAEEAQVILNSINR